MSNRRDVYSVNSTIVAMLLFCVSKCFKCLYSVDVTGWHKKWGFILHSFIWKVNTRWLRHNISGFQYVLFWCLLLEFFLLWSQWSLHYLHWLLEVCNGVYYVGSFAIVLYYWYGLSLFGSVLEWFATYQRGSFCNK